MTSEADYEGVHKSHRARDGGRALGQEVIAAHGGAPRWDGLAALRVQLEFSGLGFRAKFVRNLPIRVEMVVEKEGQRVTLEPYPGAGRKGVFEGSEVRIEAANGRTLRKRAEPRAAFRDIRHKIWWDALDVLYFAGQAGWTYFHLPFVLTDPGYELREAGIWRDSGETWRKLRVTFPPGIHTHCRQQVLYVDNRGMIRRHDYTAEPFGDRAKAAHYCSDPVEFDGLVIPTRRRVYPRRSDGRPRSRPVLVWIDVKNVTTIPEG